MSERKRKTKVKEKSENLADQLNQIPSEDESAEIQRVSGENTVQTNKDADAEAENDAAYDSLFNRWDEQEFEPQDFMISNDSKIT